MDYNKISRCLSGLKSRKFPKCSSLDDLDKLFSLDKNLREKFGTLRGKNFYEGIVEVGCLKASIFIIKDLVEYASHKEKLDLFIDGTFNVSPLYSTQMLVIMAQLKNSVSLHLIFGSF